MGVSFDIVIKNAGYYFGEVSNPPASFDHQTARLLGVKGDLVTEQSHLRLFAGLHPETGERLPGLRNVANRRGGWDITFTSDKSSSILKLVAGDDRIGEVERKAENAALKLLEQQVRVRVAKKSEVEASKSKMPKGWKHPERFSGNMITARYGHDTSREGDPHAHGHLIVYNVAFDKVEKQFKTIELRYIDRKGISDAFHKEYARGMRGLGYKARWDGKELSIQGVPREVKSEFSRRHNTIKAKEAAYDARADEAGKSRMSPKSRQRLGLFQRPEKEIGSPEERRSGWLGRLSKSHREGLARLVDKARASVSRDKVRASIQRHLNRVRHSAIEAEHDRGMER